MKQRDDNNDKILRRWHHWHREQLSEALAGPHGAVVKQIVDFLRDLTPQKMLALLDFMHAQNWCGVDANTRFVVLHELNFAIANLREREGRPPFDDALPFTDESPTVFEIARTLLSCTSRENPAGDDLRQKQRT